MSPNDILNVGTENGHDFSITHYAQQDKIVISYGWMTDGGGYDGGEFRLSSKDAKSIIDFLTKHSRVA